VSDPGLACYLNLWRGVFPLVIEHGSAIEEVSLTIAREIGHKKLLPPGSELVVVGVSPNSIEGRTDFIRLIRI
jgi:hypothetical protein